MSKRRRREEEEEGGGGVYHEDIGRIQCCTSGVQWVYIRGRVRVQWGYSEGTVK